MTAVEWLIDELKDNGIDYLDLAYEIIEKAKELEKQQIKNAYNQGYRDGGDDWSGKDISLFDDANLYYNETYNKP
jgi:hypothetical protein